MGELKFIATVENRHFVEYWEKIHGNMETVAKATKKVKDIERLFGLVEEQIKKDA